MTRETIEGFTLVEMTEEEVELEFGYDFSLVPGAVSELAVDDGDGTLFAYGMEDGTYSLFESGRGKGRFGDGYTREEAIEKLLEDAKAYC